MISDKERVDSLMGLREALVRDEEYILSCIRATFSSSTVREYEKTLNRIRSDLDRVNQNIFNILEAEQVRE